MGNQLTTKQIHHSHDDARMIFIYHLPSTKDFYVVVSDLSNSTPLTINDNYRSDFKYFMIEYETTDYRDDLYCAYIYDLDLNNYILDLNGKKIAVNSSAGTNSVKD